MALKVEEEATRQGMWMSFRNWKRQGHKFMGLHPKPWDHSAVAESQGKWAASRNWTSEGNRFSPGAYRRKAHEDFWLQNWKSISLYCVKPWHLEWSVAIGHRARRRPSQSGFSYLRGRGSKDADSGLPSALLPRNLSQGRASLLSSDPRGYPSPQQQDS